MDMDIDSHQFSMEIVRRLDLQVEETAKVTAQHLKTQLMLASLIEEFKAFKSRVDLDREAKEKQERVEAQEARFFKIVPIRNKDQFDEVEAMLHANQNVSYLTVSLTLRFAGKKYKNN